MISAGFLSLSRYIPGPLLWHFEDNATSDPSIELDLEEVKALASQIGFEIKVRVFYVVFYLARTGADCDQNERRVDTTYVNNKDSMLGYVYHAAFWTATKRL